MAYSELTNYDTGNLFVAAQHDAIRENFDFLVQTLNEGRLTLTSGDPVADNVSAGTNIYYAPYRGNRISLWDGANEVGYTFSELTLSLSGSAANTNYDVFIYSNLGTLTLEAVAWSSATARSTGISQQDGIHRKSGALTRRLLGTFRTTGSVGQCADTPAFRYLWNYQNRIQKRLAITESANSWTYASAVWRSFNNTTANSVGLVCGLNEDLAELDFTAMVSGGQPSIGIGLDAAGLNVIAANASLASVTGTIPIQATFRNRIGLGYHVLYLSEIAISGTTTFYGDNNSPGAIQSGAEGSWWC